MEKPFKFTSKRISALIFAYLGYIAVIYFSKGKAGVNPFIWFLAAALPATIVGVGTGARSDRDTAVVTLGGWGFDITVPIKYIVGMVSMGAGVALLYFSLVSRPASILAMNMGSFVADIGHPLYMPLTTGVKKAAITSLSGSMAYYAVVAFFEEAFATICFKITTNFLVVKKICKLGTAGLIGIIVAAVLWGSGHYSAWAGFSLASFIPLIVTRMLFWSPFAIVDNIGIISEAKRLDWARFSVWGGFSAHFVYDVLIQAQDTGKLGSLLVFNQSYILQGAIIGLLLVLVPIIVLLAGRYY